MFELYIANDILKYILPLYLWHIDLVEFGMYIDGKRITKKNFIEHIGCGRVCEKAGKSKIDEINSTHTYFDDTLLHVKSLRGEEVINEHTFDSTGNKHKKYITQNYNQIIVSHYFHGKLQNNDVKTYLRKNRLESEEITTICDGDVYTIKKRI
jgi:hypothetical protein